MFQAAFDKLRLTNNILKICNRQSKIDKQALFHILFLDRNYFLQPSFMPFFI